MMATVSVNKGIGRVTMTASNPHRSSHMVGALAFPQRYQPL
jgi:hypothetical protein